MGVPSYLTGLRAKCKALTWNDVNACSRGLTTYLDRHLAFALCWVVLFCVFVFVPQINTYWPKRPWQSDFTWSLLSVSYFLFLVGILLFHVYAWWAVLPSAAPKADPTRWQKLKGRLKAPPGWFVTLATWPARRGPRAAMAVGLIGIALGGGLLLSLVFVDPADGTLRHLAVGCGLQVGWLLLLTGAWVGAHAWHAHHTGAATRGDVVEVTGRTLALLWFAMIAGEGFWLFAWFFDVLGSFRLYTIGGLLQVGLIVVLVARVVDVAHVKSGWPIRYVVAGALILGLALLNLKLPWYPASEAGTAAPREEFDKLKEVPPGDGKPKPSWYDQFNARLDALPDDDPVVFVAASGGGSRAAIFAGLAFEALSREPFPDAAAAKTTRQTWADRVVLVSSVSGGSLATADFVEPSEYVRRVKDGKLDGQPELLNSNVTELKRGMASWAAVDNPFRQAYLAPAQHRSPQPECVYSADHLNTVMNFSRQTALDRENGEPAAWLLYSPLGDDMCGDFMAPIVRGALTPLLDRGTSLSAFWEVRFGWKGCSNLSGYASEGYKNFAAASDAAAGERAIAGKRPLVLFNSCDTAEGGRVVVGFPPLPRRGLAGLTGYLARSDNDVPSDSESAELYRGRTLADFSPNYRLSLAESARVSANFPWGLPVARLSANVPTVPEKMCDRAVGLLLGSTREEKAKNKSELISIIPDAGVDVLTLSNGGATADQKESLDDIVRALYHLRADEGAPPASRQEAAERLGALKDCLAWTTDHIDLTDGGVNENTGIATLCEVIEHLAVLEALDNQPADKDKVARLVSPDTFKTAAAIMAKLRRHDVVLVEIDSGAKPSLLEVGPLAAPLRALNNASYATAFSVKDRYLDRLIELLAPPRDGLLTKKDQDDYDGAFKGQYARQAMYKHFECNHDQEEDVMTAWGLPNKAKARIYTTFYFEYQQWKNYEYATMRDHWVLRKTVRRELFELSKVVNSPDPEKPAAKPPDRAKVSRDLNHLREETMKAAQDKLNLSSPAVKDKMIQQGLGAVKDK
jgi:hypothetical protein